MKFIRKDGLILWGKVDADVLSRGDAEDVNRDEAPAHLGADGISCWYFSGREYKGHSARKDSRFPVVMFPDGVPASKLTREHLNKMTKKLIERQTKRQER
jgi:hypothetical protein